MNFGILESQRMCWQEVLAIGKTVVHDGRRCHIAGMTRGILETKLYSIEPFQAPGPQRKGVRTHRRDLKENTGPDTVKIPAELFCCVERAEKWEERIE